MDPSRFIDVDSRVVEELLCPVCGTVPIGEDEPLQLPCQHLFCRTCIERALLRKNECPVDRSPVQNSELRTSRPIRCVISRLKVTCDYAERGCTEAIEVNELARHVKECPHSPVKCQHCNEIISRRRLTQHEGSCPKRKIACGLEPCTAVVPMDQLTAHHNSDECLGKKIACPNGCGITLARGFLANHQQECQLATIGCRCQAFGCKWQGGRSELEKHAAECWFEKGHDFLAIYKQELDRIRQEVAEANEQNEEKVRRLEAKLESQDQEMHALRCQMTVQQETIKALQEQSGSGYIYALGGHNGHNYLNSVERYDRVSNTWQQVAPMSAKRYCMVAAVLGGYPYALGGYDGSHYLPTCERYNPATNMWVQVASMSIKREWAAAVVLNGCIYAIGGYDGQNDLSTMEKYDPLTNTWDLCASMRTSRSYLAAAVFNGRIYATGGYDGTNYLPTCEWYDPVTNTWHAAASMCSKRSAVAAVVLNGYIYAIGGYDGSTRLATVERYNPAANQWQLVTPMNHKRGNLAAAVLNSQIYVVGGYDGHVYHSSVERYDPALNTWRSVESMCIRRRGVAVSVAG